MRTRRVYIIVDMNTNKILHTTADNNEHNRIMSQYRKAKAKVTEQCINQ